MVEQTNSVIYLRSVFISYNPWLYGRGRLCSEHRFSDEDLIANALGSTLGYFLYPAPALADKIDFR